MSSELRKRLAHGQGGFTVIELFVVLVIIAILMTVAVGSYFGFRQRSEDTVAKSNVRAILPAIEAYFADNKTYANMTIPVLKATYDSAIDPARYSLSSQSAGSYCISSTYAGLTWRKEGPGADIVAGDPC